MFNPFSLFSVIATPSTPALDDTQEFRPITLMTRAVEPSDFLLGYDALNGHLCRYNHFRADSTLYTGHIVSVTAGRNGIEVYVQPDAGQGIEFVKPYHLSEVRLAWWSK